LKEINKEIEHKQALSRTDDLTFLEAKRVSLVAELELPPIST
jgi:hypothetical protein